MPHAYLNGASVLFWLVLLIALGIIFIGVRSILTPLRAAHDFGVPETENAESTYLWAKGTRDIVSGLIAIGLLWLRVRPEVIAVFILIASLIPLGDLLNVYAHIRGRSPLALFIHGGTALCMWVLATSFLGTISADQSDYYPLGVTPSCDSADKPCQQAELRRLSEVTHFLSMTR